jgi:UDP-2,3-diacylglucosamine pyrophosphatase LpxH
MDQRATGVFAYRSVFISDVHLGTPDCQAELLADFLDSVSCERLYLVGDIVDGWRLKRGWRWPPAHDSVVRRLLAFAQAGVPVTYVPGNHDDRLREFGGVHFAGVEVVAETVHQTADGRRFLVAHGDQFDVLARRPFLRAWIGEAAYKALVAANTWLNHARRSLGLGYWSLSTQVKTTVGRARRYIEAFEAGAAEAARRRGLSGVICGHIHRAALREISGVLYVNDGDWVESCTALVEHLDGALEIVDWAARRGSSMIAASRSPLSAARPLTPEPLAPSCEFFSPPTPGRRRSMASSAP